MPKSLKERIRLAAEKDRRDMAPWAVIQLEKILDDLEREHAEEEQRQSQHHAPLESVKAPRKSKKA